MTAVPIHAEVTPAVRPRGAWGTVLLGVLLVGAILPRLGFLARPFESDAGLYIYMGKVVAEGGTLYRDFYETKPPGVALLTTGLYKVFGAHWWPYVLLQASMAIAAAGLLARAAGRAFGERAAWPTLLFGLVFLNFSPTAYRGFQLETVQTFLACAAAYFGVRAMGRGGWDWFWMGLCGGAAAMLKPTAVAVMGALLVVMLVRQAGAVRAISLSLLGAMVAPLLVVIWVWRAGLMGEMAGLFREISLYGTGTPLVAADWMKLLVVVGIGGFAFLVAWAGKPRVTEYRCPCHQEVVLFAVVWLALECIGVVVQKRMYAYHIYPLAAPVALLFGVWCRGGRRPVAYAFALGPVVAVSLAVSAADFRTLAISGQRELPESTYLRARAAAGDRVFGDGIERLLMETGLTCGSRYAHLLYFANHDAAPLEYGGRFLDDLDRDRPEWAVFATRRAALLQRQLDEMPMYTERPVRRANFQAAWGRIEAYLAEHYLAQAEVGDVTVYRRK